MDQYVQATARAIGTVYRPWVAEVRCLDLAEEVGELARAVLVAEQHKSTARQEPMSEDVGEALCGVLVDVFALADHYRVGLDELYPKLLAQMVAAAPGRKGV